jgi:predicted phage baseplate assembly protein
VSLPVPNLDDRRFQDIVDEAKRMIPRLCPEWTNHNISDPGVALIELFAWMTELTLYRLNQVPDRMYTQFLNLMGIAPFPARAATADLTFWLSAVPDEPIIVPAGTEIAAGDGDDALVFTTMSELRIEQSGLSAALTGRGEEGLRDVLGELHYDRDSVACFPSEPISPGDAMYLGFDRCLAGQAVELTIVTAASGVGIDPLRPPIAWECWTGEYWVPCVVHQDDTGGLNRSGTVVLMVPRLHEPLTLNNQRKWWVRVRLTPATPDQPTYRSSPLITSVEVACLGGTVKAEHSEPIDQEDIGRASGQPGEEFRLGHRPILPRKPGENIVVTDGGTETVWTEVSDFSNSGEKDRHVVWDDAQGIIRFGPAIRYPDGRLQQHGAIPPMGGYVTARSYRHGGGVIGNLGRGMITSPRAGLPFIDRVENLAPASGGVDPESDDNVKNRGPQSLRTGQRAVTASDYERLSLESTSQVARARCVVPERPGHPVRVLVVPRINRPAETLTIDDMVLTDPLFQTISSYLDERRVIGSSIEVTTPYYVGVSVAVLVRAATGRPHTLVRQQVLDTIFNYLSPFVGGSAGTGWPWDKMLTTSELLALVASVDGVSAVDELVMFEVDLRNGTRLGDAVDVLTLDGRSLFLGARHRVVVS